ncbi:MAG: DUF1295 domain-containing protein [Methyloprofundus sp.]|nr:DUF1295 domain-containing protein [Methyloprofundus sp.]MDT8425492.1 DUF1295 domain-containing protein [Methyloprofundus sp.]
MTVLCVIATLSSLAMFGAWLWQQHFKNAGIVDVVWAFGMMFAGPVYAFTGNAPVALQCVLAGLSFAWFLRLGLHLLRRFQSAHEEGRYQTLRNAMGKDTGLGFFLFFQLQAGFIVLLTLPFWAVAQNSAPNPLLVISGLILALFALWGETTADQQLAEFRGQQHNKGTTCRHGWWRYSRHPNYFFEWLHWFAYPLMGWGSDYQVVLWLAPLVMFAFLYFFTGIPYTERQALLSRGDDYRRYQQSTSAFFPWWPKPSATKI